jgi:hypothetical protein
MTISRFCRKTSGLLLVAAALLSLTLVACGSPATPTTSATATSTQAAPTIPPTSPTTVAAGKKWSGQANQYNYGKYQMNLTIASVQGSNFAGTINWPSFTTTTKMSGTMVTDFGDATEKQRWHYVPGYDKGAAGTYVKFTETDYVQGSGVELHDVYYALVQPDGTFQGVWFKPDGTQPSGDYLIKPQTASA